MVEAVFKQSPKKNIFVKKNAYKKIEIFFGKYGHATFLPLSYPNFMQKI